MSRWEDTALSMPKITKDPIIALIESQTDDVIETREADSPEDWDSVYGDQDEAIGGISQEVTSPGSRRNPIDVDDHDFLSSINNRPTTSTMSETCEETYSRSSMSDKIRSLEQENARLMDCNQQLKKRIYEMESGIPGMSNHYQTSRDHVNLSATILVDGREFIINNLSPQMSGWDFTRRVFEVTRKHPGNMIVMQHLPIQPDLPLYQLGLGSRPFYAISLGDKQIEPGRSIKVKLFGPGPLI